MEPTGWDLKKILQRIGSRYGVGGRGARFFSPDYKKADPLESAEAEYRYQQQLQERDGETK